MTIFIATDHAGFSLKEPLASYLRKQGHEVIDKGAYEYDEEDDYPDFVIPLAKAISADPRDTRGIVLGATGHGEVIAANRFPNVRGVVYYGKPEYVVDNESDVIERSRVHYNANVLILGVLYLTEDSMLTAVKTWLGMPFTENQKYLRRLGKIDSINNK